MDTTKDTTAAPAAPDSTGMVDVESLLAKVKLPPQLQPIYDKAVLSGMRIMFDSKSHPMMQQQLDKPGPLAPKIITGVTALIYMLWKQSNQTLPPRIILPLAFALTLKAFDYLQRSGDAEATKDVLGQAIEGVMAMVAKKFQPPKGGAQAQPPDAASAPAPTTPPPAATAAPSGLLAQGGGQ